MHREVTEEVGIGLDHLAYAGSQAWPFPGSLMLGFLARADPAQPVRVDPTEIAQARWFSRREITDVIAGTSVPRTPTSGWACPRRRRSRCI